MWKAQGSFERRPKAPLNVEGNRLWRVLNCVAERNQSAGPTKTKWWPDKKQSVSPTNTRTSSSPGINSRQTSQKQKKIHKVKINSYSKATETRYPKLIESQFIHSDKHRREACCLGITIRWRWLRRSTHGHRSAKGHPDRELYPPSCFRSVSKDCYDDLSSYANKP